MLLRNDFVRIIFDLRLYLNLDFTFRGIFAFKALEFDLVLLLMDVTIRVGLQVICRDVFN